MVEHDGDFEIFLDHHPARMALAMQNLTGILVLRLGPTFIFDNEYALLAFSIRESCCGQKFS